MPPQTWSPPSSPFLTDRQRAATASTLSFADGVLTWAPAGLKPSTVGSLPFSARVGAGPGDAQVMVWIVGELVIGARGGSVTADVLAVCTADPRAASGRRVLGYLPSVLVRPTSGAPTPTAADLQTAQDNARAIADATGLAFEVYRPEYGANVDKIFPGAIAHAGAISWLAYLTSAVYVAPGMLWIIAFSLGGPTGSPVGVRIGLEAFGVLLLAFGVLLSPPILRRLVRRRAIEIATEQTASSAP